jgi:hypothetical protein
LVRFAQNFEFTHSERFQAWRTQAAEDLSRTLSAEHLKPLIEGDQLRDMPAILTGHLASGSTVGADSRSTGCHPAKVNAMRWPQKSARMAAS